MDSNVKTEWTPGPWKLSITHNDGGGWRSYARQYQITAGDKMIAYYETNYSEYPESDEENDANARRIIHAVNAHDRLVQTLRNLTESVKGLINESSGVYGLHLNGDLATWPSLTKGGSLEEWLLPLADADALLAALSTEQKEKA